MCLISETSAHSIIGGLHCYCFKVQKKKVEEGSSVLILQLFSWFSYFLFLLSLLKFIDAFLLLS